MKVRLYCQVPSWVCFILFYKSVPEQLRARSDPSGTDKVAVAQIHFAILKGRGWEARGQRASPCQGPASGQTPQLGVPERFTHGQERVFDRASEDQIRWNSSEWNRELSVRQRHAMNLLQMTSSWPMLTAVACCKSSESKSLVLQEWIHTNSRSQVCRNVHSSELALQKGKTSWHYKSHHYRTVTPNPSILNSWRIGTIRLPNSP